MALRRKPTLAAIENNPTLHSRAFALVLSRFPRLKWHFFADSHDSSQAFALSAFLPVLEFPDRDLIIEQLVTGTLSAVPSDAGRSWDVIPEFSSAWLLGEGGRGEPTSADILLIAEDTCVCVECKFRVDARQGWGRCSQPPRFCDGFHGKGSDRKGSAAACRLELPDRDRGPRLYWQIARGHFREHVFAEQRAGDICPFLDSYQLVRNYLLAARLAEHTDKAHFGVIGIAPAARWEPLAWGMESFRDSILVPANSERVAVQSYERYVQILAHGSPQAKELAAFLSPLL